MRRHPLQLEATAFRYTQGLHGTVAGTCWANTLITMSPCVCWHRPKVAHQAGVSPPEN